MLVPVNNSPFPSQGTDRSVIVKRLNEIYGPAVVNWNVSIDKAIEVLNINEADFIVEGTALLSKYTSDMNRVIRTYKRDRVTDDNTLYLFFMTLSNLGSSRKGFMPLAGNYGFIFNFEAQDLELLAHELAHGAFNLRHTFSDKSVYYFPVNQTANLMDYAGGTELWKYQWDLIHNPESILFAWGQDEEEGVFRRSSKYWITVNGQRAILLNLDKMKEIQDTWDTLSKDTEILSGKGYASPHRIRIGVIAGEGEDSYTISSEEVRENGKSSPISQVFFSIDKKKEIQLSPRDEYFGELYYAKSVVGYEGDILLKTHSIELVEVKPNIAFKSGDGYDYILKIGGADGELTKLITSYESIELLPVFLKSSEYTQGVNANDIEDLFERNTYCNYLIDTIKVNNELTDERVLIPIETDWTKYDIESEGLTFEVISNKSGNKATIQSNTSPFVTVIRDNKNEDMGYYIEDYYTTATVEFGSKVIGFDDMKTITLEDQNQFDYMVPIVHSRNASEIRLTLVSKDIGKRGEHDKDGYYYYIDGKKVKIGNTFTITPKYGTTVDIIDENGIKKGAIEFKKHTSEVLRPVLNIIYLGDDLPDGMTQNKILNNLNSYYEVMGIEWIPGKVEKVAVENYYKHDRFYEDRIFGAMSSSMKANEYYMIVVAPGDNKLGDFAKGVPAFTYEIGSNVFFHRYDYSEKRETLQTVPHELAHCNGLDEFAYDFGLTTIEKTKRETLNSFPGQWNNSNAMGYFVIGNNPPKMDFFSTQISTIRQTVKARINSTNQ
ncbi:hypothetical protein ACT3CD_16885 [Geofilum sp. OHC36d9]|uniref:hypothetical protein n=1 Tax=Geofilum sp. OHC36d9 TaxID=3458413 RepID=UPI0040342B0C